MIPIAPFTMGNNERTALLRKALGDQVMLHLKAWSNARIDSSARCKGSRRQSPHAQNERNRQRWRPYFLKGSGNTFRRNRH
jgi:hypothetical protein